jgi:hypothetical protein
MTKSLPFTEIAIQRAIAAVRKAGLEIYAVTVGADGSITVHQHPQSPASSPPTQTPPTQTETDRWTPEV